MLFFCLPENQNVIKVFITKLPMKPLNTSFINLIKVLGALDNPNGMTNPSYNP